MEDLGVGGPAPPKKRQKAKASATGERIDSGERAANIMGKHIVEKTKSIYTNKLKVIVNYMADKDKEQSIEEVDSDRLEYLEDGNHILKLPLDDGDLNDFFGYISQHADGSNKSVSDLGGYTSTISNEYKIRKIPQPDSAKSQTSQFMAGYRKQVAKARQDGEMPLHEGKTPFTFEAYLMLCLLALTVWCSDYSIFMYAHLYFIFCWNLMARSCSVANIHYTHLGWEQDSLVGTLPTHKGDESGAQSYPKHIYANPLRPEICPILALGLHVMCTAHRKAGSQVLLRLQA